MATPSNYEQIMADIFASAIDRNAPYAKVMFREAANAIARLANEDIDRLRAALKPFAELADRVGDDAMDEASVVLTTLDGGIIDTHNRIKVVDLRRARAASR